MWLRAFLLSPLDYFLSELYLYFPSLTVIASDGLRVSDPERPVFVDCSTAFLLHWGRWLGLRLLLGWRPCGALPSYFRVLARRACPSGLFSPSPSPPLLPPVICVLGHASCAWRGVAWLCVPSSSPIMGGWHWGASTTLSAPLKDGRLQSATVVTLPPVLSSLSFVSAHCRLSAPPSCGGVTSLLFIFSPLTIASPPCFWVSLFLGRLCSDALSFAFVGSSRFWRSSLFR